MKNVEQIGSSDVWLAIAEQHYRSIKRQFKRKRASRETFRSLIDHLQLGWHMLVEEERRGRRFETHTVSPIVTDGGLQESIDVTSRLQKSIDARELLEKTMRENTWWLRSTRNEEFFHLASGLKGIKPGKVPEVFEQIKKICMKNATAAVDAKMDNKSKKDPKEPSQVYKVFAEKVCSLIGSDPLNVGKVDVHSNKNLSVLLADLEVALGLRRAW